MKFKDIIITQCDKYYKGIGTVYLVQGIGKRAIKVILRPFFGRGLADEEMVIKRSAAYANKKGWKIIWVEPDQLDGETVRMFNLHQQFHESWSHGFMGKFLCMARDADVVTESPYSDNTFYDYYD